MRYSSKHDSWYPLKLTRLVDSIVLKFVESIIRFILFHAKDIIFLLVSYLVFIAYICWCHYFSNLS